MKLYHFALIFILFFILIVIQNDIKIGDLKAIENEKEKLTTSLETAASDTIQYLSKSGVYGTNTINKNEVVTTFLTSLYSAMGIISDKNKQEELEMYLPVILLCDTDGYYIYYYDQFKSNGLTYTERTWSEKMPYYYKDDYFIYRFTLSDIVSIYDVKHLLGASQDVLEVNYHELQTEDQYAAFRNAHGDCMVFNDTSFELAKKSAIINQLEKTMAYYTSQHNKIAQMNGITYTFSFPPKHDTEWAKFLDDVNLIAVFQGYPYGINRNYTYNKILSIGANVRKKEVYFVEKKSWYYLAHKQGCPKLDASTTVLDETFESLKDCASMGAYYDDCIKNGARAPQIN